MNDLETFDPKLAQKLERKKPKYNFILYADGQDPKVIKCLVISEARAAYHKARKEKKWDKWEVNEIINKGEFNND